MEHKIPSEYVLVKIDKDISAQLKEGDLLTCDIFGGVTYRVGSGEPGVDANTLAKRKSDEHLFLAVFRYEGVYKAFLLIPGNDLMLGVYKPEYA